RFFFFSVCSMQIISAPAPISRLVDRSGVPTNGICPVSALAERPTASRAINKIVVLELKMNPYFFIHSSLRQTTDRNAIQPVMDRGADPDRRDPFQYLFVNARRKGCEAIYPPL